MRERERERESGPSMLDKIKKYKQGVKIALIAYDLLIFAVIDLFLNAYYRGGGALDGIGFLCHTIIGLVTIFSARLIGNVYRQIWRYGGIGCYIRLLVCDSAAFLVYLALNYILPIQSIALAKLLSLCCMNTLASMSIRMLYRYAYKYGNRNDRLGVILRWILKVGTANSVHTEPDINNQRIKAAIVGAGSVGAALAGDLRDNPNSRYIVRCFIDIDEAKIGRDIGGISVLREGRGTVKELQEHEIQEIIFAVPRMDSGRKFHLYQYYAKAGFRVMNYDYPLMSAPGQKRQLRGFRIEDLLMRQSRDLLNDSTRDYYKDKVILITGGGGSIGSELCVQLASMNPKKLIVLDIYENGAYDLQQNLKILHKNNVDLSIEICSITNYRALSRVFREYHPDICINSAAHKHVPLMEKNCIEAVENNVFGTFNVIKCCEEFGCGRFMMVSTDKAVNPTNVMGASKRLCEMLMQAAATRGRIKCSATRFGNVMGSAGSVIPLFEKQIAAGGPVTLTDKRIVRYFMTIPEASQLVLTSGAMAENGEIFVLDMGSPVKIYDLAQNMISMSGMDNIEIIETGLRPGEKLYEELIVDTETMEKTDNDLIYIDREKPVSPSVIYRKMALLKEACESDDDAMVRDALKSAVPTFRSPEEVNGK